MDYKKRMEKLVSFCKQTGYIYPGSEIYGGLANTFDYGPLGSLLKKNIKEAWIQKFIREIKGNVLLDGPILLNPKVWQSSGHVSGFSDPLIECKSCNNRFRADNMLKDLGVDVTGFKEADLSNYIKEHKVVCPSCGKHNFTDIRSFNMMFETNQGVIKDQKNTIYLRPENAQNVFIQFKNIQRTTRNKLPFGIAHIGKAFRNEITPGNFIFRTREFEQMELEFFCKPGEELSFFKFFKKYCMDFIINLGVDKKHLRFDDHKKEDLAHYSNATTDIQYEFPWGFDELYGIASRTNFDLTKHQEGSGEDLQYLDSETNEKYIPYVVEPSVGVERLVFTFLNEAYQVEQLENNQEREVLKIHPFLAPYKVAVLPLQKKEHSEKAMQIYNQLIKHFDTLYDETQNIGKRYRREDMIGTPFCVTIDNDTLANNTVTIRNRDTMKQEIIKVDNIVNYLNKYIQI